MSDPSYLETLQDFYAKHRVLPSYATIGEMTGLRSKSSVAALVARLKLAGFLDTSPGNRLKPGNRFFDRPLAESVRAGLPQPVDSQSQEVITIDEFLIDKPSKTVLVRVKGDSMIDAGIHDGDMVIIRRCDSAENGDIVVALVEKEEATLKRLRKRGSAIALEAANPNFETRIFGPDQIDIQGRLVALIRRY